MLKSAKYSLVRGTPSKSCSQFVISYRSIPFFCTSSSHHIALLLRRRASAQTGLLDLHCQCPCRPLQPWRLRVFSLPWPALASSLVRRVWLLPAPFSAAQAQALPLALERVKTVVEASSWREMREGKTQREGEARRETNEDVAETRRKLRMQRRKTRPSEVLFEKSCCDTFSTIRKVW